MLSAFFVSRSLNGLDEETFSRHVLLWLLGQAQTTKNGWGALLEENKNHFFVGVQRKCWHCLSINNPNGSAEHCTVCVCDPTSARTSTWVNLV